MTEDIDPNDIIVRTHFINTILSQSQMRGQSGSEIGDHEQYTLHIIKDKLMEVEMSITRPAKRRQMFMDFISMPPRQKILTTFFEESVEEMIHS